MEFYIENTKEELSNHLNVRATGQLSASCQVHRTASCLRS